MTNIYVIEITYVKGGTGWKAEFFNNELLIV